MGRGWGKRSQVGGGGGVQEDFSEEVMFEARQGLLGLIVVEGMGVESGKGSTHQAGGRAHAKGLWQKGVSGTRGTGDCSVMSEGKKRLEMSAGASPGSTHQSMSAVDFLLPAVGSHGMFDRRNPTIRVML